MKLRRNTINNILFNKRRISDSENKTRPVVETKINKLEDFAIPTDFQFRTYKYYENVIFL